MVDSEMKFRAYADNVVIKFIPDPKFTESGLKLPAKTYRKTDTRKAVVVASGPGHYRSRKVSGPGNPTEQGPFVRNETRPGDIVLVDAFAGQDYALDLNIPRHNKNADFEAIGDERGEFRVVREAEIHCILERAEDKEATAAE